MLGRLQRRPAQWPAACNPRVHVTIRSSTIPEKTIALNRRARHEFTIEDTLEAGLVLTGTEIKSIRAGKVNLADAYARIERDEAWLVGAHIAPFEQANRYNHEPKRVRKLLLRRSEIDELLGKTKAKGLTIVPLRLYLDGKGRAKIELGLARGKQAPRPPSRHRRSGRAARHGPRARRRPAGTDGDARCREGDVAAPARAARSGRSTSTPAASPAG